MSVKSEMTVEILMYFVIGFMQNYIQVPEKKPGPEVSIFKEPDSQIIHIVNKQKNRRSGFNFFTCDTWEFLPALVPLYWFFAFQ